MKSTPKNEKNKLRREIREAAEAEAGGCVRVPEQKPLRREIAPPTDYPVDALGERLAPVARALEDVSQGALEACAQLALSVANASVQGLADVRLPHGVRPISLFFLCVLDSGERKSAIFSAAMHGIERFESKLRSEYATVEELRKAGADVPLPPLPIVTISESTIDGLMRFLTECRGPVLLASDEGAVFANGHSMASRDLMRTCALYSSLWDSSPQKMVRATTNHRVFGGKRVGVCLMAQPPAVAQLLTNHEARAQGLLARFLMSMPVSRVGGRPYRVPADESLETLEAFHRRVFATLKRPLPLASGERNVLKPRYVTLSPEAVEVYKRFHDAVEAKLAEGRRYYPIREFGAKAADHAVRLAATITLFHNRDAVNVTAARMRDGVTLAKYYLREQLRIAAAEGDADLQIAEKAIDWINRRGCEVVALSELYRLGPPEIRKAATARRIAKILVEHGYLAEVDGGVEIDSKLCEGYLVL